MRLLRPRRLPPSRGHSSPSAVSQGFVPPSPLSPLTASLEGAVRTLNSGAESTRVSALGSPALLHPKSTLCSLLFSQATKPRSTDQAMAACFSAASARSASCNPFPSRPLTSSSLPLGTGALCSSPHVSPNTLQLRAGTALRGQWGAAAAASLPATWHPVVASAIDDGTKNDDITVKGAAGGARVQSEDQGSSSLLALAQRGHPPGTPEPRARSRRVKLHSVSGGAILDRVLERGAGTAGAQVHTSSARQNPTVLKTGPPRKDSRSSGGSHIAAPEPVGSLATSASVKTPVQDTHAEAPAGEGETSDSVDDHRSSSQTTEQIGAGLDQSGGAAAEAGEDLSVAASGASVDGGTDDTLQQAQGETPEQLGKCDAATEEAVSDSAGGVPVEAGTPPARQRRRRVQRCDLLRVPGVGPRTLVKLQASGIDEVAALTKVYREKRKKRNGIEAMVEYLRQDVGVRKDYATLISTFVKREVEVEEGKDGSEDAGKEEGEPRRSKRLTLCVEGNISVGKSTFLQRIQGELLKLHEVVEVVPEPIEQWQDVGRQHVNLLQEFYDDPRTYAYTFQNYVFVTRVMQSLNTSEGEGSLRLMERSIFSDRMVFVRAVHEAKWLDDVQLSVYDSSFDPFVHQLPGLVPDGFIYLRAQPETCHERLMRRAREEETKVSLEYLCNLHEKHEGWLLPETGFSTPIIPSLGHMGGGLLLNGQGERSLLVDPNWPGNLGSTPIPDKLRGRVFGLQGASVHPSIENIPALVLDCNQHIDFNVTPNQVNLYAEDIRDFVKFVNEMKSSLREQAASPRLLSPDQCLPRYQDLLPSLETVV